MVDQEAFLEQMQEKLTDVVRPYQQQQNRRQRMADFVKQCIRCAGRNDFFQLDELLKSKMARDVEEEVGLQEGIEFLDQLRTYADEQVERYRIQFIEDLKTLAREAELPIEIDFPRIAVLKGIEGEVDFAQRKTEINKKVLKSVDPKRIITALRRVKQQLYDRPYDPQVFIDKLYHTYTEILKKEERETGHPVPMQQLYLEYVLSLQSRTFFQDMDKGRFRGYSLDQFAVDIWCYFQARTGGTSNGYAVQLRPGRNRALWLIDSDGERRQITAIAFQEQTREKGPEK